MKMKLRKAKEKVGQRTLKVMAMGERSQDLAQPAVGHTVEFWLYIFIS